MYRKYPQCIKRLKAEKLVFSVCSAHAGTCFFFTLLRFVCPISVILCERVGIKANAEENESVKRDRREKKETQIDSGSCYFSMRETTRSSSSLLIFRTALLSLLSQGAEHCSLDTRSTSGCDPCLRNPSSHNRPFPTAHNPAHPIHTHSCLCLNSFC